MATITLQGNEIHTNGDLPSVGSKAPDFHLVDGKLSDVHLTDYAGKKKLLNIVPSLDTGVCAASTKKFNETAGKLENTVGAVVTAIGATSIAVKTAPTSNHELIRVSLSFKCSQCLIVIRILGDFWH